MAGRAVLEEHLLTAAGLAAIIQVKAELHQGPHLPGPGRGANMTILHPTANPTLPLLTLRILAETTVAASSETNRAVEEDLVHRRIRTRDPGLDLSPPFHIPCLHLALALVPVLELLCDANVDARTLGPPRHPGPSLGPGPVPVPGRDQNIPTRQEASHPAANALEVRVEAQAQTAA